MADSTGGKKGGDKTPRKPSGEEKKDKPKAGGERNDKRKDDPRTRGEQDRRKGGADTSKSPDGATPRRTRSSDAGSRSGTSDTPSQSPPPPPTPNPSPAPSPSPRPAENVARPPTVPVNDSQRRTVSEEEAIDSAMEVGNKNLNDNIENKTDVWGASQGHFDALIVNCLLDNHGFFTKEVDEKEGRIKGGKAISQENRTFFGETGVKGAKSSRMGTILDEKVAKIAKKGTCTREIDENGEKTEVEGARAQAKLEGSVKKQIEGSDKKGENLAKNGENLAKKGKVRFDEEESSLDNFFETSGESTSSTPWTDIVRKQGKPSPAKGRNLDKNPWILGEKVGQLEQIFVKEDEFSEEEVLESSQNPLEVSNIPRRTSSKYKPPFLNRNSTPKKQIPKKGQAVDVKLDEIIRKDSRNRRTEKANTSSKIELKEEIDFPALPQNGGGKLLENFRKNDTAKPRPRV